jgi:hypothetical protein
MGKTSNDLVLRCAEAARDGGDFQTVWDTVLRKNALVVGPPIQTFDHELPQFEIQLINGQRLVYRPASNEYFVLWALPRRPF